MSERAPRAAHGGHAPRPVRFGDQYWLLQQIAIGGMAEIYLARQNAMAGFEKDVVIKRLKPELAVDPRIVEMFLDEARIGAVLNHPNIVHVYDVDVHDGVPYIAMELIHGEELNQLCRRGLGLGRFLPLEHAIELIRQAAAGMGYFHHRAHRGEALDIVHLDISPTNLLVTEDGFLKVIDFGIARARGQKFRDESSIPGKLSYMSPEQAARQRVDHRSDIFSLGIVLYEITVGRRLFKGPAAEVVRKLVDCDIQPPTFVRRDFPGPLEAIVMRCLEKHPVDRYQSAYDLADDLEEVLRELRLHSGPVRIARYLDELATASGGQRRPELISESEQRRGDDDLDFDSKVFDAYRAAETLPEPAAAAEWDEYEEGDEGLAEALGMDLDRLRQMRTPLPGQHRDDDDDDDDPPFVVGAGGLGLESQRLPLRAPPGTPVPTLDPVAGLEPAPPAFVAPPAAPPPPQAPLPQAPVAPRGAGLQSAAGIPPWVVLGGVGAVVIAGVLYLLL
jgi:serine/threonine protein kinase